MLEFLFLLPRFLRPKPGRHKGTLAVAALVLTLALVVGAVAFPALGVVVGASPGELKALRQRHGELRMRTQNDEAVPFHPCWLRDATRGSCLGQRELVDALLLAHCDYLLTAGHPAAEFAMWYNPALITRHLDLQIEGEGEKSPTFQALIPKWLGGA